MDWLENPHADLMFRTIAEAKGEGFDPVKLVNAPSNLSHMFLSKHDEHMFQPLKAFVYTHGPYSSHIF